MINLVISVIIQGGITVAFLMIMLLLLTWLEHIACIFYRKLNILFLHSKFCKLNMSVFTLLSVPITYRHVSFLLAVVSALCYLCSFYMAFNNNSSCLDPMSIGMFLTMLAILTEYHQNNRPPLLIAKTLAFIGVSCLVSGLLAVCLKYYLARFIMYLVGTYLCFAAKCLYELNPEPF